MIVRELIEKLKEFDENLPVKLYDDYPEWYDLTSVQFQQFKLKYDNGNEIKTFIYIS